MRPNLARDGQFPGINGERSTPDYDGMNAPEQRQLLGNRRNLAHEQFVNPPVIDNSHQSRKGNALLQSPTAESFRLEL